MQAFRVLSVELAHETNTFCLMSTDLDSFRRQVYITGDNEVRRLRAGTRTSLGATFEASELFGWDLCTPLAASANPSGRVLTEVYEYLVSLILSPLFDAIRCGKPFDGIAYHLHGAMVAHGFEDAEGELLERTRAIVGPDIPIVVTLDLHGNITQKMCTNSSTLIAVRTYPHIDAYEIAWKGLKLLQRAMLKEVCLETVIAKRPTLKGLDGGKTQAGPMRTLLDKGDEMERLGHVVVVSICAGFTAADIFEIGPSVTVTYDKLSQSRDDAEKIANDFMDYVWATKDFVSAECYSINEVVELLCADEQMQEKESKPIIVADITDNPGSGHYGDATNLLKSVIKAKLKQCFFYAIYDPSAVREGISIGVGNTGTIMLGGKHDPAAGGGPLSLTGRVVTISDGEFQAFGPMGNGVWQNFGLSMVFRVGGVDIAVISNNGQLLDISQITSLGCDPERKRVIFVKSKHHFRASLESLSKKILLVDGEGLGSYILKGGIYKNVRRPIWPLDNIL